MRVRLLSAGLVVLTSLVVAPGALGATTFDAGRPLGSPVVAAGGVAWGAADGLGSALRFRDAAGTTRALVKATGTMDDEGFYGTSGRIAAQSAVGDRIVYATATYDSAASKYDGGDGLTNAGVSVLTIGGTPQSLASCGYGLGSPTAGLGTGFTIVGGCYPQAFNPAPANVPPVRIDGAVVGTGGSVTAAGPFAAWDDGQQLVVTQPPAAAPVSTIARGWPWALSADGSVAQAKGVATFGAPAGEGRIEVTPPGGATAVTATEPGGVLGLRAGGAALVYATTTGLGERTVVVQRGGQRTEVGRLWAISEYSPEGFSTDGERVAFLSPRCGGTDITVATIGEPVVDRRVGPCPVTVDPDGLRTRRSLSVVITCDPFVPPVRCAGTAVVRRGGRVLARGTFAASAGGGLSATLPLTAAGRRVVAVLGRRAALRGRVQVAREAGTATLRSSAAVAFAR